MISRFIRFLTGHLEIEVTGDSVERLFNMCIHHHIQLRYLRYKEQMYYCDIRRSDFKKLKPFIRKTNTKIRIIHKVGIPFVLFRYRKRYALFIGGLVCILSIYVMSQHIWKIEVSGNDFYSTENIMEFLYHQKIQITMRKNEVECQDIVSIIRAEYPNIIWVSAHVQGTELLIRVKEHILENKKNDSEMNVDARSKGWDIVAKYSGTVDSIITRVGTPVVHAGDEVKKGEVLVSGCIEILGDDKSVVGYEYVKSDADIRIKTQKSYEEIIPMKKNVKVYKKESDIYFNIQLNKYYIQKYSFYSSEEEKDIVKKRILLTPPFQDLLTIEIEFENHYPYILKKVKYEENEIQHILSEQFKQYCMDLEKKRVEILEKNVKIHIDEKNASARGTLNLIMPDYDYQETDLRVLPEPALQEGYNE